jgi:nucleoside 2-deoxyribosyltransferase
VYYVAHRLFAAHDRALAARIADRLAVKVGADNVFLPFCDTDEEDLVADVKGRRLFELDGERLRRLTAMVAVLHGPGLDDGVCMEIGYATALGTPVVVVTTDFQTYSLTEEGPQWTFPDPLVECLASRVVRVERLAPFASTHGGSRFEAFVERNQDQVELAVEQATDAVLGLVNAAPAPMARATQSDAAYVEPSPYVPRDPALDDVMRCTKRPVHWAGRFRAADPHAAARADWANATASELLIADITGPEAPPGAAALIGAAAALGHRVLAYQPRPAFTHAHGREANWRNLMIQYAASGHITSAKDLAAWINT